MVLLPLILVIFDIQACCESTCSLTDDNVECGFRELRYVCAVIGPDMLGGRETVDRLDLVEDCIIRNRSSGRTDLRVYLRLALQSRSCSIRH